MSFNLCPDLYASIKSHLEDLVLFSRFPTLTMERQEYCTDNRMLVMWNVYMVCRTSAAAAPAASASSSTTTTKMESLLLVQSEWVWPKQHDFPHSFRTKYHSAIRAMLRTGVFVNY